MTKSYIARDSQEEEKQIEWIQQRVHIPCKLYSMALAQIQVKDFDAKKKNKRVTYTPYLDAIVLLGWLQYTYKWQREEGRTKDEIMPLTMTYIQKGLHWSHPRVKQAIEILLTHKLIVPEKFILRDKSGRIISRQQGLRLVK